MKTDISFLIKDEKVDNPMNVASIIIIAGCPVSCPVFPAAAPRHRPGRFNDAEEVLHEEDGAQVHLWFHHGEPLLH